jgi:hypothetical protein
VRKEQRFRLLKREKSFRINGRGSDVITEKKWFVFLPKLIIK